MTAKGQRLEVDKRLRGRKLARIRPGTARTKSKAPGAKPAPGAPGKIGIRN